MGTKKVVDIWGDSHKTGKCWESHPDLIIDGCSITGGSCTSTYAEDFDVYIGLDYGAKRGKRSYPWTDGVDVYFRIQDMGVPDNLGDFKKLIKWTAEQMREGKSVFVGCIGGHGRTGLFLSALVNHMTGEKDATTLVREQYCERAVESTKQVDWLHKHFGIKKVKPYKSSFTSGSKKGSGQKSFTDYGWGGGVTKKQPSKDSWVDGKVSERTKPEQYYPVEGESLFKN